MSEDAFFSYIYKSQKDVNPTGPNNVGASINQKNNLNSQVYNDGTVRGSDGGQDASASAS